MKHEVFQMTQNWKQCSEQTVHRIFTFLSSADRWDNGQFVPRLQRDNVFGFRLQILFIQCNKETIPYGFQAKEINSELD